MVAASRTVAPCPQRGRLSTVIRSRGTIATHVVSRSALALAALAAGCLREPLFTARDGGGGGGDGGRGGADGGADGGVAPGLTFPPEGAALSLREPVQTDLDGDSLPDLLLPNATTDAANGVYILLGQAPRASRFHAHVPPPSGPVQPVLTVHAADLDGDGVRDLLVLTGDGLRAQLLAYRGRSATRFDDAVRKDLSTWFAASATPSPSEPNGSLAVLQLDGEGGLEIVVAGKRLVYAFTFPGFQNPAFDDAPRITVPGRVTGGAWDGVTRVVTLPGPRLLVVEKFDLAVFEAGPLDALAARRHDFSPAGLPFDVTTTVDLDGNGAPGLLAIAVGSSALMALQVWPMEAYARWPGGCLSSCDYLPTRIAVADLDGSGRPELVTAGTRGGVPRLVLMENARTVADEVRTNSPLVELELPATWRSPWLLGRDRSPEVVLLDPSGRTMCLSWTPGALAPCGQ